LHYTPNAPWLASMSQGGTVYVTRAFIVTGSALGRAGGLCKDLQNLFKASQVDVAERVEVSYGSGQLLGVIDHISPGPSDIGAASSVMPQRVEQACDGTNPLAPFSLTLALPTWPGQWA
jgi:hypothetical protein